MDPERERALQEALSAEQQRLQSELASFATRDPKMADDWDSRFPAASDGSGSHASQEEQADFREAFESDIAQEHALESRLREVNAALERIADRTFGFCRACGKPIPEERLGANPAAAYDIEHQPHGGA